PLRHCLVGARLVRIVAFKSAPRGGRGGLGRRSRKGRGVRETRMTKPAAAQPEAEMRDHSSAHRIQMRVLVAVLTLAGLWVARSFLIEVAWAVTLAIALWPLYRRATAGRTGKDRK